MTYIRVQLRDQAFVLIPQNMVRETTVYKAGTYRQSTENRELAQLRVLVQLEKRSVG